MRRGGSPGKKKKIKLRLQTLLTTLLTARGKEGLRGKRQMEEIKCERGGNRARMREVMN